MKTTRDILDLIGRIFISAIFFFEAYDSIAFYKENKVKMEDYGLIWQQDIFLTASIIFLIMGGIFLLIGYRSKFAALLLIIYWLPLTFTLHSFWNDPKEIQRMQSVLFMKDIAVAGGLLMVMVNGSGKFSVRRLLSWRRRIKLKENKVD